MFYAITDIRHGVDDRVVKIAEGEPIKGLSKETLAALMEQGIVFHEPDPEPEDSDKEKASPGTQVKSTTAKKA